MSINFNQPMKDYLNHPAIGSSHLKQILYSPRDFKMYKSRGNKDTPQTILGEASHCILTEFHLFNDLFAVQPEYWGPKNSNPGKAKWDAFKKENLGKKCLGWEDKKYLDDLMIARKEHKGLCEIFDEIGGNPEVTAYTDYVNGIQLKARTDWLGNDGILWDIKTSSKGVSDSQIHRTILDMGYHFQAAHHMRVIGDHANVVWYGWIFVDTDSPSVNIVTRLASKSLLDTGERDLDSALDKLDRCLDLDEWPRRYDDEILEIGWV